jgi:hypothetical protein
LNCGVSLGTSPTVVVEDLPGQAGDFKSLVFAGDVAPVFNFIT